MVGRISVPQITHAWISLESAPHMGYDIHIYDNLSQCAPGGNSDFSKDIPNSLFVGDSNIWVWAQINYTVWCIRNLDSGWNEPSGVRQANLKFKRSVEMETKLNALVQLRITYVVQLAARYRSVEISFETYFAMPNRTLL